MALSKRSASKDPSDEVMMSAFFYILRLKSGRLYPGATTNLKRRLKEHFNGTACHTTRKDPPVGLARKEMHETFGMARRREIQVKKWSSKKKAALTTGDSKILRELSKSHDD